MAPRGPGSKAYAVREYLQANPNAGNIETVKALAEKGIKVTAKYVSNIKQILRAKHVLTTKRQAVKKVVSEKGVSIPEIKAALVLLKLSGSVETAKAALAAAEEIRSLM